MGLHSLYYGKPPYFHNNCSNSNSCSHSCPKCTGLKVQRWMTLTLWSLVPYQNVKYEITNYLALWLVPTSLPGAPLVERASSGLQAKQILSLYSTNVAPLPLVCLLGVAMATSHRNEKRDSVCVCVCVRVCQREISQENNDRWQMSRSFAYSHTHLCRPQATLDWLWVRCFERTHTHSIHR